MIIANTNVTMKITAFHWIKYVMEYRIVLTMTMKADAVKLNNFFFSSHLLDNFYINTKNIQICFILKIHLNAEKSIYSFQLQNFAMEFMIVKMVLMSFIAKIRFVQKRIIVIVKKNF